MKGVAFDPGCDLRTLCVVSRQRAKCRAWGSRVCAEIWISCWSDLSDACWVSRCQKTWHPTHWVLLERETNEEQGGPWTGGEFSNRWLCAESSANSLSPTPPLFRLVGSSKNRFSGPSPLGRTVWWQLLRNAAYPTRRNTEEFPHRAPAACSPCMSAPRPPPPRRRRPRNRLPRRSRMRLPSP